MRSAVESCETILALETFQDQYLYGRILDRVAIFCSGFFSDRLLGTFWAVQRSVASDICIWIFALGAQRGVLLISARHSLRKIRRTTVKQVVRSSRLNAVCSPPRFLAMDSEQMLARDPRKVYYGLKESQQKSTTREILQARSSAADCPTTMRPPPTGEDSNDSERSKGKLVASLKSDSFVSSPIMTARRVSKKESTATQGYSGLESDEEKLAPLGYEPEGSAASTPQCERWPTSLNDMLMDCQGFNSFYQFLKQENSEILLDFWRASESFKRMAPISHEMRTTAKAIFQKFIFPGNALEVSNTTRTKIAHHVNDQPMDCGLFEEALSEIMANLKNNHYPRFLNTTFCKECIQSGGESPQGICERFTHTARFHGGYLPPLPEEKVLGFDEIEDDGVQFEFEQHHNSAKGLPYCAKRSGSDEHNAR